MGSVPPPPLQPQRQPQPLPPDFTLRLDRTVRRPAAGVLIGGSPIRLLRLTPAGAALVDRWAGGAPVGTGRAAGVLAARLVEAGVATPGPPPHPLPAPVGPPGAPPASALRSAVVIPVRDDPGGLAETLASLTATAPGVPVTVVDDGSEPPVVVRTPVRLHRRNGAGGPAVARNAGRSQLDPDVGIVVFVDAGCVMEPGWLETVLAHFADPATAAVAPRVRSRPGRGAPAFLARYESARSPLDLGRDPASVGPGRAVAYVPTAALAVRAQTLEDVGGFDERMRFGEDVDLVWRLVDAGWRVRYEPSASVTHPCRPDGRSWLRQRYDYGRSAAPLAARHGRAVAPLSVSPWSVAAWSLLAVGRPGASLALVAGSAEALARRPGNRAPAVAAELRRLAWRGQLRAGGSIASAIRRAWLPPALLAGAAAWRVGNGRTRAALLATTAAVLGGPGAGDWWGPGRVAGGAADLARWSAWHLADDLAYQAGVWAGAVQHRSAGALLPRWWAAGP